MRKVEIFVLLVLKTCTFRFDDYKFKKKNFYRTLIIDYTDVGLS